MRNRKRNTNWLSMKTTRPCRTRRLKLCVVNCPLLVRKSTGRRSLRTQLERLSPSPNNSECSLVLPPSLAVRVWIEKSATCLMGVNVRVLINIGFHHTYYYYFSLSLFVLLHIPHYILLLLPAFVFLDVSLPFLLCWSIDRKCVMDLCERVPLPCHPPHLCVNTQIMRSPIY